MKIGYQGDFGSNSYYVAKEYDGSAELVPLISSEGVIHALDAGKIDLGVVAVENTAGGIVVETKRALENSSKSHARICTIKVPIHHSLFKRPGVKSSEISYIASHLQALKQTRQYTATHFPNAGLVEAADTALAAADLANGNYDDRYAVICRKECGLYYGLELIAENVEDVEENITTFAVLR